MAAAVVLVAGIACGQNADDVAARAQQAREQVAALEAELEAAKARLAAAESELAAVSGVSTPDPAAEQVYTPSWLEGWEGSVEAGINGSDGNSEQFSARAAVGAKRKTERTETSVGAAYHYATNDGNETSNRFEAFVRNDWLLKDSRWRFFATGKYETDQFQDWDHRLSGFAGAGYEFIDHERTTLLGRAGLGGAYRIGGSDESFDPEALLGLDLTHQLTERQRIVAGTEFFPNLEQTGEFRWHNRAAWEIDVDPEVNMFLRIGAEHRHDSDPGPGFKPNDLDYFLTLGWTF